MTIDQDLPQPVHQTLRKLGINSLYPPQEEAIRKGLFNGRNLVVASPTASGKTLIALMLIIHRLAQGRGYKHIYLVPLKALAAEKRDELIGTMEAASEIIGWRPRVAITTSDYDSTGEELGNADVIIATYEKMDSIMRHRPSWIDTIRTVVVDEAHLVGVADRGPVVENILMRILAEARGTQVLLLSATISNYQDFAHWIEGEAVVTNWRPIPLREGVLYDHEIYYSDNTFKSVPRTTGEPIIDKAIETIEEGGQVLIFTATRAEAKRRAKKIAKQLAKLQATLLGPKTMKELRRLAERVKNIGESTKLSEELSNTVAMGVAFHHAGLGLEHRALIEEAFRSGLIKILTATPTLAAGVNLPSRTVIITYTSRRTAGYVEEISVFDYKQMAGRAGRPMYDKEGEALIHTTRELEIDTLLDRYIRAEPEPITSRLLDGENMEIAILSLTTETRGVSLDTIHSYIDKSLAAIQYHPEVLRYRVDRAVKTLLSYGMVTRGEASGREYIKATRLGSRTSQLYILPSTGYKFYTKTREITEPSELGLLHLICETRDMVRVNARKRDFDKIIDTLEDMGQEEFLNMIFDMRPAVDYDQDLDLLKTALVLLDWINEATEDEILEKWGVEPGDLYNLYTTAEWLAYAASEIARIAQAEQVAKMYNILRVRLKYGVKPELIPLVSIPGIGRRRARILYNNGYRTPSDLRRATIQDLASIPNIGVKTARKILEYLRAERPSQA